MTVRIWGIIFALIVIFFTNCKKFEKNGHMQQPGIALTFDDGRVDNWYRYLPLMDSLGIKATFYICKYKRLTNEQKNKLHAIENRGHEIAYHTVSHYNLVDYIYKYHHTIEELMQKEIECGLKEMNKDGFYPVTFAYPYGVRNGVLDKQLMRYFKSVRALNGTYDYAKSLASTERNDLLYGFGIDKSSNHSDPVLINLLKSAKNNGNCAILVVHDINSNGRLSVSLDRLLKIVQFAKEEKLKFYTVSEISN